MNYVHGIFLCSPLLPLLLTWNPLCCDRIRPPSSQVARKLTSPFPHLAHIPSHPNPDPPGFSRSKYTLTRTTLRTQPISSRTLPIGVVHVLQCPCSTSGQRMSMGVGGWEPIGWIFLCHQACKACVSY